VCIKAELFKVTHILSLSDNGIGLKVCEVYIEPPTPRGMAWRIVFLALERLPRTSSRSFISRGLKLLSNRKSRKASGQGLLGLHHVLKRLPKPSKFYKVRLTTSLVVRLVEKEKIKKRKEKGWLTYCWSLPAKKIIRNVWDEMSEKSLQCRRERKSTWFFERLSDLARRAKFKGPPQAPCRRE